MPKSLKKATLTRRAFVVGAPLALAACSADPVWAPDAAVNAAAYRGTGQSALTLFTVKNTGSGNGAHSALLIDGSQRVLFDPAGSFKATTIPERNDVLFGFSPAVEQAYVSFHARPDFYVVIQKIAVSPAVADQALRLAMANGAVPQAHCSRAISRLLSQLPGFDAIGTTWFPNNLSDKFGTVVGVTSREVREQD
jgi:hypothetical protein